MGLNTRLVRKDFILFNKNTFITWRFFMAIFWTKFDKKIIMYYISIMRRKPALVWDEWNKKHIEKHNINIKEAEEAYTKREVTVLVRHGRQGVLSKISNGRLLIVFISYERQIGPYIVSARDASRKERRFYYEKTKSNPAI